MMSRGIEDRWRELSAGPDRPAFQLLDAEHPLPLYIGRAVTGQPMLLLVDAQEPPVITSMRSVEISTSRRSDGRWNLLLTLRRADLSGPFALLCEDLAAASRYLAEGHSGMELLVRRLSSWRRLLEEGRGELLTASQVRGLMGELVLLDRFLASGVHPSEAVSAWVGPLRANQDFQFHDRAWEVKTVFADAEFVEIASESQLDSSERELRLVVVTLVEGAGETGISLNDQVLRMRSLLEATGDIRELFEERLMEVGYVAQAAYDEPVFRIGRIRLFQVDGEFPRLRPSDLPEGVQDVDYRIRLDACLQFATDLPPGWN
jgi:hypothetical protein